MQPNHFFVEGGDGELSQEDILAGISKLYGTDLWVGANPLLMFRG